MEKNNIAIIGGAGFVGTRLTSRLQKENKSVKVFDKNNIKS